MKFFKIILLLLLIGVIYSQSNSELWQHIADKDWIASYVSHNGVRGELILLTFGILFTACGGPRQLIAFTFGFTFGSVNGVLLTLLCTVIGAAAAYMVAHFIFKQALLRHFGRRYQRFQAFVSVQPFTKVLVARIFPVGSNLVTNLLSGVASVPFTAFMMASLIGYMPQTLIFALAGSGLGSANQWQLIVSIVLGIISLVLTGHLYRRYKKQHAQAVPMGE